MTMSVVVFGCGPRTLEDEKWCNVLLSRQISVSSGDGEVDSQW
jgi:hypothetical protein